jgi:hypothetical protein
MIVRILGEGQLQVPESAVAELNDEPGFRAALEALLARIREVGEPAEPDALEPSGLIVPQPDATMAEVRQLLTDEGLISG